MLPNYKHTNTSTGTAATANTKPNLPARRSRLGLLAVPAAAPRQPLTQHDHLPAFNPLQSMWAASLSKGARMMRLNAARVLAIRQPPSPQVLPPSPQSRSQ
jgi:hypothetical protein